MYNTSDDQVEQFREFTTFLTKSFEYLEQVFGQNFLQCVKFDHIYWKYLIFAVQQNGEA